MKTPKVSALRLLPKCPRNDMRSSFATRRVVRTSGSQLRGFHGARSLPKRSAPEDSRRVESIQKYSTRQPRHRKAGPQPPKEETLASATPPPKIAHPKPVSNEVDILVDGIPRKFSPVLLRDLCNCPRCVDPSSKQKEFNTTEIPDDIQVSSVHQDAKHSQVRLTWRNDVPRFNDEEHTTVLDLGTLRQLAQTGSPTTAPKLPDRVKWNDQRFRQDVEDIDYEDYMSNDSALHKALLYLHTHGLLFLTNVPEQESSVATIAERIGPVKNTFYGFTWDVRSVPQAKNVAYTSQDLGFHMDLLYLEQPPHLQFLHCIRASSAGGASTFTDSHRAALDLFKEDVGGFAALSKLPVNFHYNHAESGYYYHRSRSLIELKHPLFVGGSRAESVSKLIERAKRLGIAEADLDITQWIDNISWSPPFQAPFARKAAESLGHGPLKTTDEALSALNFNMGRYHALAKRFDQLIHRPEGVYERMMKPGECVLFDNRRVLHARTAFQVGDIGKERWLRGAYVDRDPYESKLRVLQEKLGNTP